MITKKLIQEMGQDVVEVTTPQTPSVTKYSRDTLKYNIESHEQMIIDIQQKIDEWKDIEKLLPKEIIEEVITK